jgi:ribonuclease HI
LKQDVAKSKYYVVWVGKQPGVYTTWAECQAQTNGYPQAKFKSFETESEAKAAYEKGWKKTFAAASAAASSGGSAKGRTSRSGSTDAELPSEVDMDSISVDVGCSGNPGIVEYKGVYTKTGEVIFSHDPIPKGTNNMGEFLAVVHALAYLKKSGSSMTVYSDSMTALSWVRKKEVASNLVRDASTEQIWTLVDRALLWLKSNSYPNKVLKWNTKAWGEIKADYGRK